MPHDVSQSDLSQFRAVNGSPTGGRKSVRAWHGSARGGDVGGCGVRHGPPQGRGDVGGTSVRRGCRDHVMDERADRWTARVRDGAIRGSSSLTAIFSSSL